MTEYHFFHHCYIKCDNNVIFGNYRHMMLHTELYSVTCWVRTSTTAVLSLLSRLPVTAFEKLFAQTCLATQSRFYSPCNK